MRCFGLSLIVAAVLLNLMYCLWANPFHYPYPQDGQILGFVYLKDPGVVTPLEAGKWGLVLPIAMLGAGLSFLFHRHRKPPEPRHR